MLSQGAHGGQGPGVARRSSRRCRATGLRRMPRCTARSGRFPSRTRPWGDRCADAREGSRRRRCAGARRQCPAGTQARRGGWTGRGAGALSPTLSHPPGPGFPGGGV